MNPELEERIAGIVNRMVVRDIPEQVVFQFLEVNRITGDEALKMYQNARRARIKAIRVKLSKKAIFNMPWLLVVMVFEQTQRSALGWERVFRVSTLIISMFINPVFIPAFIGLWRIINPLLWVIFAPLKKGSFDDDET